MTVLSAERFSNKDTVSLARYLIGKRLTVAAKGESPISLAITETEAYDGPEDLACHASKGLTPRTSVMFGPSGHWYVYLIYGMHEMLNLVTGPEGYPAAILIRGVDGIVGPGRLTKRLNIHRSLHNAKPAGPASGLYLLDAPPVPDNRILTTPRIGVDYAGPYWSQQPYRFVLNPT